MEGYVKGRCPDAGGTSKLNEDDESIIALEFIIDGRLDIEAIKNGAAEVHTAAHPQ